MQSKNKENLEMNGIDIVFDTNALIEYLGGNPAVKNYSTSNVFLSILSIIEFLSYPSLSKADKNLLDRFLLRVAVVPLDMGHTTLIEEAAELRKLYRLKLPDAVIAATALNCKCSLVSNDKELEKIPNLSVVRF